MGGHNIDVEPAAEDAQAPGPKTDIWDAGYTAGLNARERIEATAGYSRGYVIAEDRVRRELADAQDLASMWRIVALECTAALVLVFWLVWSRQNRKVARDGAVS